MTHLWTIGFQVVNFLLLFFLLHRFLWKPVRATIDQRKKTIDDEAARAKTLAKAADESRVAYEAKALAVDHARARVLAETAVALAADREQVLAKARALADVELRTARETLATERQTVATALAEATLDVAETIAEKLLHQVRSAAVVDAFLDRICERIEGLPSAEMASLRAELEANPTIRIATAPALDDPARARLGARLATVFGAAAKVEFFVDDALIAGAELRLAHVRIGSSFQQSLAAARNELLRRDASGEAPLALTRHEEIVDT